MQQAAGANERVKRCHRVASKVRPDRLATGVSMLVRRPVALSLYLRVQSKYYDCYTLWLVSSVCNS